MISTTQFEGFNQKFTAVGCIVKYGNNILLLLRDEKKPHGGLWGLPAGKVESTDKTLKDAMIRELFQEAGISVSPDQLMYIRKYYVRYPTLYDFVFHFSYRACA